LFAELNLFADFLHKTKSDFDEWVGMAVVMMVGVDC
jgi:hypothetical protein